MNVLAIDQGTSATKALVVTSDGTVLGEAEVPVPVIAGEDGSVEIDPEVLWRSVVDAGTEAIARAGVTVEAVGLANQGETVLAWDAATTKPLTPAIVWQDRRAASVCERVAADGHADWLAQVTGLVLDPYFVAPKLTWLRENMTRAGTAGTTDAWMLQRLTGAFVTDAATASRSLLLDLDKCQWSPDACAIFDLDPASMPEIVDCAAVIGETSAFGASVPVAGLAVDQQAALFAESCFTPGDAKCTYGTGAFLLANLGATAHRSRNGLVSCVAWRLHNAPTYCLDGQVFTAGAALTWLESVGLLDGPEDLDRLAGTETTSGGVSFVPAFTGLGAPFWSTGARAAFTGLSIATTRAHLARAVVEGIAAQVAWLARAAGSDLGKSVTRLRVDGGLTRSRTLLQVQADLAQVPVEVYPSPHATALGVAAFARLGAGAVTRPEDAVGVWSPLMHFEPSITAAEADERLAVWRAAAEATVRLAGG
ncbi:MAG: glycerol kinase [Actinomycetia bacterium]|nr:glycerol kinase [Actinomycetes bacterium]